MQKLILPILVCFFSSCYGQNGTTEQTDQIATSFEFLSEEVLQTKTKEELRFIRNEVFARKGYVFKDQGLNDYYSSKKWYNPNPDTKVELTPEEESYINKIKGIETSINAKKSLSSLQTVNLEKERKAYESKGLKVVEEVKGYYNDDSIADVVWVINKMTRPEGAGYPKMEYWLQVFLGTSTVTEYKILIKSGKVIPCNNCETWQNKSDYSYYDVNLENQKLSFYTNQWTQGVGSDIKFNFEFVSGSMILNQIKKKQVLFKENERNL